MVIFRATRSGGRLFKGQGHRPRLGDFHKDTELTKQNASACSLVSLLPDHEDRTPLIMSWRHFPEHRPGLRRQAEEHHRDPNPPRGDRASRDASPAPERNFRVDR